MLERSFPNPPLLFVTEVVQDKVMKTHGIASIIVASCAGSAETVFGRASYFRRALREDVAALCVSLDGGIWDFVFDKKFEP